jgi:hypothetical protein
MNGQGTKNGIPHDKRKKMQNPIELNSESANHHRTFFVTPINKETIEYAVSHLRWEQLQVIESNMLILRVFMARILVSFTRQNLALLCY